MSYSYKKVGAFLIILFFTFACSKMEVSQNNDSSRFSVGKSIIKPLEDLQLSSSDLENHKSVFGTTGETRADYGYSEIDGNMRGHFLYNSSKKALIFERSIISGDIWADHTIFPPNNDKLKFTLGEIQKISLQIKAQINKTNPNIPTGCGVALGFGESSGHFSAVNSPTSLRLFDRDWRFSFNADKTPRDYIRFVYEPYAGDEKLTIDAPLNSFNALKRWDNFTASRYTETSGEFNVMTAPELNNEGDYISYKQTMEFDHKNALVTVSIEPIGSNLNSQQWQKQSVLWNINNAVDDITKGGDPRGGLDLRSVIGQSAMTWQELGTAHLHLGFVANLAPRLCEFSNLEVTIEK